MYYKKIEKILNNEGFILKYYESIQSTMGTIKELIESDNNCFFVIAGSQTKGKGRRGNVWYSPKGNIYISFNVNMLIDIKDHFIFNALATLSISKTIDSLCNVTSYIKWPNDVLVNGKKISGVITEIIKHKKNNYVIIGIGINVESSPSNIMYPTTYTKEINQKSKKIDIIEKFIENYFKENKKINDYSFKRILTEYKKKLLYLKQNIKLELEDSLFIKGKFEDINLDGSMIINIQGKKKNFYTARIINACN